jgi:hypothetical protein
MEPSNLGKSLGGEHVRAGTARAVCALYDELWDQPPPEGTHRDKIAASRARNRAAAHGWPPPLAWDDDTIDDPDVVPNPTGADLDVVESWLAGYPPEITEDADRHEVVRRLHAAYNTDEEIHRLTGLPVREVAEARTELGLHAHVDIVGRTA